jgi:hypothetical protein
VTPTSGLAGSSFTTTVVASDNIGVSQVEGRLINPSDVAVVNGVIATRISGTALSGSYSLTMQTALSAKSGDRYLIQVRSSDAAGNKTLWTTVGNFTVLGLYPMFGEVTSTIDGFIVQVTNYDSSFSWSVGNAVRSDLTLSGSATSTISSSGLVTMSGLKPGVNAGVLVTTTRSGHPTQVSAVGGKSSSTP